MKRIIPTRVGTSCPIISFSTVPKDHPHACGDKSLSAEINRSARGSSPRVWGQEIKSIVEAYAAGIIPTRVGTSCPIISFSTVPKDHPHACGDKMRSAASSSSALGSSPRVWGQAGITPVCATSRRIIPTRVGTSISKQTCQKSSQDHPHACGDKHIQSAGRGIRKGSSPRVWGQECITLCPITTLGIIPTRVGTRTTALQAIDLS